MQKEIAKLLIIDKFTESIYNGKVLKEADFEELLNLEKEDILIYLYAVIANRSHKCNNMDSLNITNLNIISLDIKKVGFNQNEIEELEKFKNDGIKQIEIFQRFIDCSLNNKLLEVDDIYKLLSIDKDILISYFYSFVPKNIKNRKERINIMSSNFQNISNLDQVLASRKVVKTKVNCKKNS